MVWADCSMGTLPVRLPDETRAMVEDHRQWLAARTRSRRPVSLAAAARDLLERGIRTCRRHQRQPGPAQLDLFREQERQAEEVRRHG